MQRLAIVLTLITAFLSFLFFSTSVFAAITEPEILSPLSSSPLTRAAYIEEVRRQQMEVMKAQLAITPTPIKSGPTPTKTLTPTPTKSEPTTSAPSPTKKAETTPSPTATQSKVIATPTKIPSVTPTPKQSFSLYAKKTPTPTKRLTPPPSDEPIKETTTTSVTLTEEQKFMMQEINTYRASKGLSSVKPDKNTCNFAATRAKEIVGNFNHDGFKKRIDSKSLPYPSYKSVTENIAMTSDYKKVVTMWINSSGHAENMRKDTPYVCVAQSGNYFAYEGWRP